MPTSSVIVSRLENFSSGYTGARCANDFATGSPGWLSDSTRLQLEPRVRGDQAQQLAGDVAGAAEQR